MGRKYSMQREFYWECASRAGRGRLLQIETVSGLISLFAIPIAAFWKPAEGYMNWIPLAVFAGVFFGTFIVGFVTAPYWIAKELEDEKETLQLAIENRAARQRAIDRLWELRSEGIAHRNKSLSSQDEVKGWRDELDIWRDKVLADAEIVNTNLRRYLERLDRTESLPSNVFPINGDHELWLRIMSEILIRLQEYLKREL